MNFHLIIGILVFIFIYILITLEKFNKTILSLIGACVFIIFGILSQEKGFEHVDWNVIILLISMMIIVGITKQTGLFQYVAIKAAKLARGNPYIILIMLSIITAIFSAFLDNVTTILIIVPVTILIAVELGISPIPFVISEALASNVGGTATLIGDPPNIMIGSAAKLSFLDFIVNLTPVIIIILIVFCIYIYFVFGKKMKVPIERRARIMEFDETKSIENFPLLIKSSIIISLVILGFLLHSVLHLEPATIALAGASILMLLTGHKEIEHLFHEVEWSSIFFFFGLFIMVGGLVEIGVIKTLSENILKLTNNNIKTTSLVIIWLSGIISAIVDNIPYVATMIPLLKNIGNQLGSTAIIPLWWSLALGACLGGNATLIGASANVVSAGISGKSGYKISFLEFTKYGLSFTIISLFISSIYVYIKYLL